MLCKTCARPVDDRYAKDSAGEYCVDESHDAYLSPELAESSRRVRETIRLASVIREAQS